MSNETLEQVIERMFGTKPKSFKLPAKKSNTSKDVVRFVKRYRQVINEPGNSALRFKQGVKS